MCPDHASGLSLTPSSLGTLCSALALSSDQLSQVRQVYQLCNAVFVLIGQLSHELTPQLITHWALGWTRVFLMMSNNSTYPEQCGHGFKDVENYKTIITQYRFIVKLTGYFSAQEDGNNVALQS